MSRNLNPREQAFCKLVAADYSGAEAARRAGYSSKGGAERVAATRLLARPDIQAEVARCRVEGDNARVSSVNGMIARAIEGANIPDGEAAGLPHIAMGVERAYQQHLLLVAGAMAVGEMAMPADVIMKPRATKDNPNPKPIVHEASIRAADPRAAVAAAIALGKEIDRIEGLPPATDEANTIDGHLAVPLEETALGIMLAKARAKHGLPPMPPDYDPNKDE